MTPIGLQVVAEVRPFGRRHDEGQVVEQAIRFVMGDLETEPRQRKVGHGAPRRPQHLAPPSARGQPLQALVRMALRAVQWPVAPQIRSGLCRYRLEEEPIWL